MSTKRHGGLLAAVLDTREVKHERTAPLGCFQPDELGRFDMAANVLEPTLDEGAGSTDLRAGAMVAESGSFLCSNGFCERCRHAARSPQGIDTRTQHARFRTAWRQGGSEGLASCAGAAVGR